MNNSETLTTQQIELLFDYCKSQRIRYYDIQLELVDHMSAWIENEMMTNGVSFRVAFTGIAEKFPASELKTIVASKSAVIRKQAVKRLMGELLTFSTWPKLLIPVTLYVLFFFLLTKINILLIIGFVFSRAFYFLLFEINFKANIIRRNKKESVRPLLLMKEMVAFRLNSSIILTVICFVCVKSFNIDFLTENRIIFIAFYTLLELALFCVQTVSVDANLKIRRKFPLAFVAK